MNETRQPPPPPKGRRLAARRQEEILAAASAVFAEVGYRQTDVQVVADRAGVGKGTVYRYFPTKEELFLAAVNRGIGRLEARVWQAAGEADDPLDKITSAARAYLAFFDEDNGLLELIIHMRAEFRDSYQSDYAARRKAGYDRWRGLIVQLIETGRIRRMPVDSVMDVLSDLLYGAIFTNRLLGRSKPFDTQATEILDILLHGLLPRDGGDSLKRA